MMNYIFLCELEIFNIRIEIWENIVLAYACLYTPGAGNNFETATQLAHKYRNYHPGPPPLYSLFSLPPSTFAEINFHTPGRLKFWSQPSEYFRLEGECDIGRMRLRREKTVYTGCRSNLGFCSFFCSLCCTSAIKAGRFNQFVVARRTANNSF